MDSNHFTKLLHAFQHGRSANIAVLIKGGISEDTEKLLVRKGFCPTYGRSGASYVVIYGGLIHHIPPSMTMLHVMDMYLSVNARPLNVSEHFLYNCASELHDHPQAAETLIAAEGIGAQMRAFHDEAVNKMEKDDKHGDKVVLDLQLPDNDDGTKGKHIHAVVCMHCAVKFLKGQSDGAEFCQPDMVRGLMAFFLMSAINAKDEQGGIMVVVHKPTEDEPAPDKSKTH